MGGWSPAPVVYGKVNRKLYQKSQSILRRLLLSSRPQHDGSTGGSERAEERYQGGRGRLAIWTSTLGKLKGGVHCSFLPLGDECEPILGWVASLIIWQQTVQP